MHIRHCLIDRIEVHLYDPIALGAVSFLDRFLDLIDSFITGKNAGNRKEAGLHDRINALAHAAFASNLVGVDHVELHLPFDHRFLERTRQRIPHLVRRHVAVKQEGCALYSRLQHVVLLEKYCLVTGDKVGFVY